MVWITPAQFCQDRNVGKSTFYREVAAGRIPIIKVGRSTRIDSADVERWVAQLRAGEGSANA